MEASDYCIIITTTDNEQDAERITQELLQNELAGCIQRLPIESAYRWKGKIITGKEIRLEIKTRTSLFSEVKETIEKLHTYEVPEIIMITIDDAKYDYLRWIEQETRKKKSETQIDASVMDKRIF